MHEHHPTGRFVVLKHDLPADCGRDSHWDLMLESDGALETWSLPVAPAVGITIVAIKLNRHRLKYLDYEGPISHDRGSVRQVMTGTFAGQIDFENARHGFEIVLQGNTVQFLARLTKMDDRRWEIQCSLPGASSRITS